MHYTVFANDSDLKTYKHVYNQGFNVLSQPMMADRQHSSHYRRWKQRVLKNAGKADKFQALELLLEDVMQNYPIEPFQSHEMFKSSGYFLYHGRFNPISIRRLYREILEDLEIVYWAGFGRSKRLGAIEPEYIRSQEVDHIFFAFRKPDGSLNVLYPPDMYYKYQINEIPVSLYDTEAVIARPYRTRPITRRERYVNRNFKMAEVDSVITNIIKLPAMDERMNFIRQTFFCDVDTKEKTIEFSSVFTASGGLSTEVRRFFGLLDQDKEASNYYQALSEFEGRGSSIQIDTIISYDFKKQKPFVFTINAKGSIQSGITFLNDSIVNISLASLLQQGLIDLPDEESADLNYYFDISYSDISMIVLNFPSAVELIGTANANRELKNEYGTYTLTFHTSDNSLTIQSTYSILKDILPKEDLPKLMELNDFVKQAQNMRLLVKLKESVEG